jgi:SAM-dependent methyltransferase
VETSINAEMARFWNSDEAANWLVKEERYERMLAPFTGHLLTAASIGPAERVIDIGCGTGSTTRAAGRVAKEGQALGVDLSAAMLSQAARHTQQEGVINVGFEQADAQVHRFTPGAAEVALNRLLRRKGYCHSIDEMHAGTASALRPLPAKRSPKGSEVIPPDDTEEASYDDRASAARFPRPGSAGAAGGLSDGTLCP